MTDGAAVPGVAIVAGGCFWCLQPLFDRLAGILHTECGYIGGHVANPGYRQVCGGDTGHAEALRIRYDPSMLSYGDILDVFFAIHDPTQWHRQGHDIGSQYRSAIFPQTPAEAAEAQAAIQRARKDHAAPVVTSIEEGATFYPAEAEHERYFDRIGDANPYCSVVIAPKLRKFLQQYERQLKPA